jgi:hypothetical protein
LAKAQAALENPEKLLTAAISSAFPREESPTFRYAWPVGLRSCANASASMRSQPCKRRPSKVTPG